MSTSRTSADLVQLRAKSLAFAADSGWPLPAGVVFTCDDCASAPECEFVFDPYNTDGDCLAEK